MTNLDKLYIHLRQLADRTAHYDFTVWFWGDSIAMDGLVEASRLLVDKKYSEFCLKFYHRWALREFSWVDHLTPGYALLCLYKDTQDRTLLSAAYRLASFLLNEVPRTADGAPLYRPDQPMYRHAMWVDTIYHIPPFYALLAQLSGEARYYDEAIHEWECHTRWLSSPEGPFLCHGVDTGNNLLKGYGWGRGTGWAVLGMVDTLELLPYEHPRYNWALDQFQALAAEVDKVQDDSGFWHTLLHDKEAYLEASTAAFFGSAFTKAMRLGLLDNDYIDVTERAWQACKSRLRSNGSFTGVSECTWAGITPDDSAVIYKTVPTGVNIWGQGSALRFVAERIHAGQDIY